MAIWENLSNNELFFILRCEKLSHIVRVFSISKQITHEQWLHDARQHYHANYDTNFISHSIFSSINDAPSYSLMTLLAIIGTVSIKVFALSLLTAGFSAATLLAGAIFFAASYQELQASRKKAEKFLDFITIKIECTNELIKRQKKTIDDLGIDIQTQAPSLDSMIPFNPFEYQNKSKLQKIKPALGAGLLTATMLFGTYYLGVSAIMTAFGVATVTAAMLGPIGLGLAITAAVLLGIYCGYRQYQSAVVTEKLEKQQNHAIKEFNHQRVECFELRNHIHTHCQHTKANKKSVSDVDLFHKQDLIQASSTQQNLLLRRGNLFRARKAPKALTEDTLLPTHHNDAISNIRPH